MLRPFATALVLGLAVALQVPAQAADETGHFTVKGAGNASCATFLEETAKRSPNSFLFAGWVNGYLTARNETVDGTFDLSSWESLDTLTSYLASYCRENPQATYFTAVAALARALEPGRVQGRSERSTIAVGDATTVLYEEVIGRMQRRLAALGLYDGEATGTFDDALREALARFQETSSLEPTGFPDQRTLFGLFVGSTAAERPASGGIEAD